MSDKHERLVELAIDWLKRQGFDGSEIKRHGGISFVQDKEMVWKFHQIGKVSDGIYSEFRVYWPRESRLYTSLSQLKGDIILAQSWLEEVTNRRVTTTERRRIEKKISNIARQAIVLARIKTLGNIFVDIVGIFEGRKVAIECGNTRFQPQDYTPFFNEVIFIPYPRDGSEPQLRRVR